MIIVRVVVGVLFGFNLSMLSTSHAPVNEEVISQGSLVFLSPSDGSTAEVLGKVQFKVNNVQRLTELGVDHVHIKIDGKTATTFLADEGYRPATIFFSHETGEGFVYYTGEPNGAQTMSLVLATKSLLEFSESEVTITIRGNVFPLVGANGANG